MAVRFSAKQTVLDEGLQKHVLATHSPDAQSFDCKPVLKTAEEIFIMTMAEVKQLGEARGQTAKDTPPSEQQRPQQDVSDHQSPAVTGQTEQETPEQDGDHSLLADLPRIINRLSIEIAYPDGGDSHRKAMSVLNNLSSFSWEAKIVLALAALTSNCGEYLLLAAVYLSEQLPESMAILKGMADSGRFLSMLKSRFLQQENIITSMLDLGKCVVEFTEPLSTPSLLDPALVSAASGGIVAATYWTIRGVLFSASNIAQVNTMSHEEIAPPSEPWELTPLSKKIESVKEFLQSQLTLLHQQIEEKKQSNAFEQKVNIFGTQQTDNFPALTALLCAKGDEAALYDGSTKKMVTLDVLRKKTVLLLISGLDIALEPGLSILGQIYDESRADQPPPGDQYQVVWIPIVDPSDTWTPDMEKMFDSNRTMIPWYSVKHPNTITETVKKFIKEIFKYQGQPILVVLDPMGKLASANAFDMIWTWGNLAFPFTKAREEALWRSQMLGLELIVNGLLPEIEEWVQERKYVVLYGGDDDEWIHKFASSSIQVRQAASIPLETLYVGKNNPRKERTSWLIDSIRDKGLGHSLADVDTMWFFWNRLQHLMQYKMRVGSRADGEDPVLQLITKLLSYDQSWASLFKGGELVVTGDGYSMLQTMEKYLKTLQDNANKEFDVAFKGYVDSHQAEAAPPPLRIILPGNFDRTIDTVICAECTRKMEKFIIFRCDHGTE